MKAKSYKMKRDIYLLSPSAKEDTISLPMISFSQISSSIDFSNIDTLMFTSKQAVLTADNIDKKWKNIPCIAIGAATKKQIESLGGNVIYHPKSYYAKSLNEDIVEFFKNKNILYLRPKEVSFDSKTYLKKEGIELKEKIIYETSCLNYTIKDKPKKNSIIIFTSPSTIKCFLKNFEWDESYIALVIGKASKIHLPSNAKTFLADEPMIDACIKKAKEIENY
ncbi:Uroporphyrinogen-III synthase [hydrothermal vent metagenome]|uniref:uroporphyrinogen-III synthase n=1 Tax=hydrothermal vent metagenome TaxID=652676 RepID=A0A1W1EC44_9ZZZZ